MSRWFGFGWRANKKKLMRREFKHLNLNTRYYIFEEEDILVISHKLIAISSLL